MGLPFQCLSRLGGNTLFCAARGCSIQTYDLGVSSHSLFSWTHPSLKQAVNVDETEDAHDGSEDGTRTGQQPPSKRRKLACDDVELNGAAETGQGKPDAPTSGSKSQKKGRTNRQPPTPDMPFVVLLTATEDGSHVIAVTGQDKTLWVFEHDGKGSLKEISQRAMPKRPCSLTLTADGQTILSADKFGDVYALPLIAQSEEVISASTPAPVTPEPLRGANVLTVHSQRNRRALEDQQRQREANAKRDLPKDGPQFAHEVLLGHVSLLTCVLTAKDAQGRPYVITADRDEHIRVSRGIPQSHIIETYCLGHGSFVAALCNPRSRPGVLISGGGDNSLFVWDWLAGKLLGTVDLLAHVREVLPDATKIAVTKLISYVMGDECFVAAICERTPAIFVYELQADNSVLHRLTLTVHGNPLDIMTIGSTELSLLVATDVPDGDGQISVFERDGTAWVPRQHIHDTTNSSNKQPPLSCDDLDKLIYTVENLRKTGNDEGGYEGTSEMPEQSSETRE
ncbi:hypothetical protein F5B22DRAFT_621010 [Xylaria bambusicola]|uniref:uncharacterized protein n=1 Tax=Xylaria bambusicola TaxID=326684 RepID=UPI00200867D6|nr:uncharacterized protein F5B22DRAFT_621010 [Xylaria bambusicola]KAI0508373.1 hypothetical protein F5B22DRAFT_621010 [Xylaria bambusicola]